jgi:hypothetical protein
MVIEDGTDGDAQAADWPTEDDVEEVAPDAAAACCAASCA